MPDRPVRPAPMPTQPHRQEEMFGDAAITIHAVSVRTSELTLRPHVETIPDNVADLANSMATLGLLQPIVVRRTTDGFLVLAGNRRVLAARTLGWEAMPAMEIRSANPTIVLDNYVGVAENSFRQQRDRWEYNVVKFALRRGHSEQSIERLLANIPRRRVRHLLALAAVSTVTTYSDVTAMVEGMLDRMRLPTLHKIVNVVTNSSDPATLATLVLERSQQGWDHRTTEMQTMREIGGIADAAGIEAVVHVRTRTTNDPDQMIVDLGDGNVMIGADSPARTTVGQFTMDANYPPSGSPPEVHYVVNRLLDNVMARSMDQLFGDIRDARDISIIRQGELRNTFLWLLELCRTTEASETNTFILEELARRLPRFTPELLLMMMMRAIAYATQPAGTIVGQFVTTNNCLHTVWTHSAFSGMLPDGMQAGIHLRGPSLDDVPVLGREAPPAPVTAVAPHAWWREGPRSDARALPTDFIRRERGWASVAELVDMAESLIPAEDNEVGDEVAGLISEIIARIPVPANTGA